MAGIANRWQKLSGRERVMIGIAFAVAVVFVGVNYVFDPVIDSFNKKKDQLQSRQQLLRKYEHLTETADRTREKLQKIAAMEAAIDRGLLKGDNPDLANAELQGIVKDIAKTADIRFTRITPSKTVEQKEFTLISLKLPFSGTIKQISKFLYEIESSPYLLNITSLSIRSRRQDKDDLRVDMEITAFIRTPQKSIDSDVFQSANL